MSTTEFYKVKNYINGDWVEGISGDTAPLYNPSNGSVLGEVPLGGAEESRAAVAAAAEAYQSWRLMPLPKRMDFIFKMHRVMVDNHEALAESIAIDQAKHIAEARGEVQRVVEILQMACTVPALIQGETITGIANNINGRVVKAPLGVFCGVAPFNFPALVFGWFIPFAIATGNTFVYKPSTDSPLFMQLMMQLIHDIGLPAGVVNIVHGGRKVVESWYDDADVVGVCLVGSTPTAKAMAEGAGRNGKKAMLLGGAKNFLVAMEDAPMDLLIDNLLTSGYGSAGQRCLASSNIIAVPEIHDELAERLLEASKGITIGDAMDPDIYMGPVINAKAKSSIERYIQQGVDGGATLLLDGRNPSVPAEISDGYYVGPTVFSDVTPCMTIAQEEIFGPVLSILKAGCIDSALSMVNAHEMGNGACIFTQNNFYTEKFINEADVGMVGVNVGVCAPHPYLPFGGIKGSLIGNNKVQGKDAIDFFTQNKTATIRVVDPSASGNVSANKDSSIRSCVAGGDDEAPAKDDGEVRSCVAG